MAEFKEIQIGADGQVYQVKDETARNNAGSGGYEPPEGGIPKDDLADDVQESLGKADTALQAADKAQLLSAINAVQTALNNLMNGQSVTDTIDTFNEVVTFLNGIDTDDPTLFNQLKSLSDAITALQNTLSSKANSSDLQNYATKSELSGKLSQSDISVETQGDGTVDINVGSGANKDTYTINLNHTHENMAKLVVCEESDLPSTLDNSTIYVITDSGETEIEKLIIRGMEFAGGGVPDTGEPMIVSPSNGSTINLDNNEGSGVSKTITIKGKNLTGDLTVAVGTGLTISYGQSTGQSSVTIPMAQALLGAQVTIAYSGSGALADGSLLISHGNDVLSSVVVVVVEAPVSLAAVKLTGTQWLQTDYCPNANTEFEMELKFDSVNNFQTGRSVFLSCAKDGDYRWFVFNGTDAGGKYQVAIQPETSSVASISYRSNQSAMLADHSILKYYKGGANAKLTFLSGGVTEQTTNAAVKTTTMAQPMAIGYNHLSNEPYANFELTIYRLTIKENGVTVRKYVPAKLGGVPGLHETVSGTFISSETSSELVAIEIS